MGSHPGYLMRRGTVMLADARVEPLPTFNDNGVHELLAIRLLLESLSQYGPAFRRFAKQQRVPALAGRPRLPTGRARSSCLLPS